MVKKTKPIDGLTAAALVFPAICIDSIKLALLILLPGLGFIFNIVLGWPVAIMYGGVFSLMGVSFWERAPWRLFLYFALPGLPFTLTIATILTIRSHNKKD